MLRSTPEFVAETMRTRLDGEFGGAYRYIETLYGGRNPYMEAIDASVAYLEQGPRDRSAGRCCAASRPVHVGKEPAAEHADAGHPSPEGSGGLGLRAREVALLAESDYALQAVSLRSNDG